MDFIEFKKLVSDLNIGKVLPDAVYLHETAAEIASPPLWELTKKISSALKVDKSEWNLVKYNRRDFKITLLNYPDFDSYAYPALHHSFTIDLSKFSVRRANYSSSDNPPILHRKETFVTPDYPKYKIFKEITSEGEDAGLFEKTRSIGFKTNWEKLIRSKGCYLDDNGRLHRKETLSEQNIDLIGPNDIDRHKTAIDRNQLSAPMQILARHGYLEGDYSILDYGCGKGDDVRELEAHGIDISSWDPVHYPDGELVNSDIVNLGFVLNVIEDIEERNETLKRAYHYADNLLIASVMVAGESVISQFTPYKDGIITSRNTFQRYYTQSEFKDYLQRILKKNPVAVGQGIFIVFRDVIDEQNFLLERQHIRRQWNQKTFRELTSQTKILKKETIEKHQELFSDFWATILDHGRVPANDEFEFSKRVRNLAGSHKKAFEALIELNGKKHFKEAQDARRNDLIVYFALGLFEKRKAYKHIPKGLQRDIKAFFESYDHAIQKATQYLFSVGNPLVIEDAANEAYEKLKHGEFNVGHSWVIHKDLLNSLPPELRIYTGCAFQLYGEIDDFDLVKLHFTSGKVSLMKYDDFFKSQPILQMRVKIRLKDLDIDIFDYKNLNDNFNLKNKKAFEINTI